jgi:ABC-type Fe3+/spermidine/putrescine transport system ATPase subunit
MALALDKVSKRFGNVWALRDLSFEIEGGSIIGIFGASGSGKTTLLKLIAGLIKTNGGAISLNGTDITAQKAKERETTFIGGHSDAMWAKLNPFSPKLASGEQQQDLFDALMANTKKVLLLDDPFTHMDADQREECMTAIRKIGRMKGRVVIFASSDFDQILSIADEVAFLSQGEIVQTGTPQDIYDEPNTKDAARLTGENNLIVARRLTSTDADLPEFHTIDGGHRLFAQNTEKVRLGAINQDVTLAIRPEQVTVSIGASYPEDNLLKGVVKAIKRMGPMSLVEFDADGSMLKTWAMKGVDLEIGDECMLGLPPHRIRILKD